jgi:ABC-type nitrate/sulfonate/bicarbonate transport system substrate-binding protein
MHLRIGGVPEHFNLPWLLAIEEGAFHQLGIELEWVDMPAGTGAIMSALANGELDLATPLTEGAITAIANGNPTRLVRTWVDSPLIWAIHVAGDSTATSVDDLEGKRFAISRFGSGSELMSRVLADDRNWELDDNSWVLVETLEGALQALPAGDAEIFLWNMSMTQPHVDDGTFRRIDTLPTPWPSFAVAATTKLLEADSALVDIVAETAIHRATALAVDSSANLLVADRYGLRLPVVDAWLAEIRWGLPGDPIDPTMIEDVAARMHSLGRIDHLPTAATILA